MLEETNKMFSQKYILHYRKKIEWPIMRWNTVNTRRIKCNKIQYTRNNCNKRHVLHDKIG